MKYRIPDTATDEHFSVKNSTYSLSKTSPHILSAEERSSAPRNFLRFQDMRTRGIEMEMTRVVKFEVDGSTGKSKLVSKVKAGINNLLVLKFTGSAFDNFYRDEYTTLVEVNRIIFSTSVGLQYSPFSIRAPTDEKKVQFVVPLQGAEKGYTGNICPARARKAKSETFAVDKSATVKATLYEMAQRVVAKNASASNVSYSLTTKRYVHVDMRYLSIDSLTLPRLREAIYVIL
ncbi:hypothetical protein D9613_011927 [Agrocybe pediades]|uniref:factor independent urate hydroxylase n=1 Tax=Agrocybe pediades TaxID=84607 RepID=A0A8H4QEL6_9AGAR|nr:hypothetical protein D9613_011927 [Agrocybe pediades]